MASTAGSHFITLFCLCSFIYPLSYCLLFISLPRPVYSAEYLALSFYDCLREAGTNTSNTLSSSSSRFEDNLNLAFATFTFLATNGMTTRYAVAASSSDSLCYSTFQNLTSYGLHCAHPGSSITVPSYDPDMAYAMFQCRGDQDMDGCLVCVTNATVRLSRILCPSYVGAHIQLDGCYVRYDNQTSIFTPNFTHLAHNVCTPGKTNDAAVVSAINDVLNSVTSQAPKDNGYASASFQNEYALAQCLGYLSEDSCSQCLQSYNHDATVCDSALGAQIFLVSCYYRYQGYSFFDTPSPASTKGSVKVIAAISVVSAVLLVAAAIAAWRYRRVLMDRLILCNRRLQGENPFTPTAAPEVATSPQPPSTPTSSSQPHRAKIFSLQDLQEATRCFHRDNKLGQGGFGAVYRGTLQNGKVIAVKKLFHHDDVHREDQFRSEVDLITSIQHRNLIKLLGCCVEGPERILVYEYLPNGSVDKLLFGDSNETSLDWSTRHGIILGMARGLAYLHEESQVRIFHRDIKPDNILLDDRFNPVIGDFGLAKLVPENVTHITITRAAGTRGYLAPEYTDTKKFTDKADVFSFGVVALEIITGQRSEYFVKQIWKLYQNDQQMELVDPKLGTSFSTEEVKRTMQIALLCVQKEPKQRPSMSEVRNFLSENSIKVDKPTKPGFLGSSSSEGSIFHSVHSQVS